MKKPSKDCACHSGRRYSACCAPYHVGARDPETPEALMRSRYSAFALGLGEYLVATLASSHEDRTIAGLAKALARAHDTQRFLGLAVEETSEEGDEGFVTFHAKIFERGVDRSFRERSRFVREDGKWRYASGEIRDRAPG